MTLLATPAPSIACCAIRLARLASDGTTPAGATNGYVTKNLAKLTIKNEVEAGVEIVTRNACGDVDVNWRDRDVMKRYSLTLEMTKYDPEFEELLLGAPLLTKTVGTGRTFADGVTTSGSALLSSPALAAFSVTDVGSTVTGTGIPGSTKIIQYLGPTQVLLNNNATATGSAVSITLAPVAVSIGTEGLSLGTRPTDNGVSLETWAKNVVGGVQSAAIPWTKWAFPATFWRDADGPDQTNAAFPFTYEGFAVANTAWGNGPWNDWLAYKLADVPTTTPLTSGSPGSKHFTNYIPSVADGYSTVPAQV